MSVLLQCDRKGCTGEPRQVSSPSATPSGFVRLDFGSLPSGPPGTVQLYHLACAVLVLREAIAKLRKWREEYLDSTEQELARLLADDADPDSEGLAARRAMMANLREELAELAMSDEVME